MLRVICRIDESWYQEGDPHPRYWYDHDWEQHERFMALREIHRWEEGEAWLHGEDRGEYARTQTHLAALADTPFEVKPSEAIRRAKTRDYRRHAWRKQLPKPHVRRIQSIPSMIVAQSKPLFGGRAHRNSPPYAS